LLHLVEEVRKIAERLGVKNLVIYLNTPLEIIKSREAANRNTGERHEVEPLNFQKVADDLEIPTSKENFVEFTPTTDLNDFLQKIK